MNKREKRAQQTRQQIIDTTMALLHQKPFSQISVSEITEKSGVATGTFYTYFPTKESIIFAMGGQFKQLPAVVDQSLPFRQRLREYIDEYLDQILDNGVEVSRQWLRYAIEPSKKQAVNNKWQLDADLLTKIFNDAIEKEELSKKTPVADLVTLLNAQIYGFFTAWCMTNADVNPGDWKTKIAKYFEKLLFPYLLD